MFLYILICLVRYPCRNTIIYLFLNIENTEYYLFEFKIIALFKVLKHLFIWNILRMSQNEEIYLSLASVTKILEKLAKKISKLYISSDDFEEFIENLTIKFDLLKIGNNLVFLFVSKEIEVEIETEDSALRMSQFRNLG